MLALTRMPHLNTDLPTAYLRDAQLLLAPGPDEELVTHSQEVSQESDVEELPDQQRRKHKNPRADEWRAHFQEEHEHRHELERRADRYAHNRALDVRKDLCQRALSA